MMGRMLLMADGTALLLRSLAAQVGTRSAKRLTGKPALESLRNVSEDEDNG